MPQASSSVSRSCAADIRRPFGDDDGFASHGASASPVEAQRYPALDIEQNIDVQWEYHRLADVLGNLFEGADPWSALDSVLALPPSASQWGEYHQDWLEQRNEAERHGVGYTRESEPSSQTLLDSEILASAGYQHYSIRSSYEEDKPVFLDPPSACPSSLPLVRATRSRSISPWHPSLHMLEPGVVTVVTETCIQAENPALKSPVAEVAVPCGDDQVRSTLSPVFLSY